MNEEFLASSEDEQDVHQLTINEHYAKAFEYRKEREELAKLKEKYGEDAIIEPPDGDDDGDSESDESEDEDGEELTPAVDAAILRTLARIKRKDPEIYEAERNVFTEEQSKSGKLHAPVRKPKDEHSKPLTLPAHRLAAVLGSRSASPEGGTDVPITTHAEEQERLRAETIAAFGTKEADENDDEDGLFTLRERTKDEIAEEEEAYRQYLEREVGQLDGLVEVETEPVDGEVKREEGDSVVKEKKRKGKKGKSKEKEEIKETDQEFLLNYILNRGWIDKSSRRVPTYDEVTSQTPGDAALKEDGVAVDAKGEEGVNDLDDDEFEEVVDRFESSYNFRFEEPDAPHIPSFPRAVETVRRPAPHTERRKEARERRRERKEEELHTRREEVKRLKGLKMREMKEKLDKIGKEGGWKNSEALEVLDLEGDWDADAYDKQMATILEQEGDFGDDEKPTWDDDIDVADIVPPSEDDEEPRASGSKTVKELKREKKKEKKKKKGKTANEDQGVDAEVMDAEVEPMDVDEEEWDGTEEMRKRVLEKYMNELYGLEFNDVVAGVPTRFGYVPVPKSSYALTPAEILVADDKDLNEYMSIKKYAPYRKEKRQWDSMRGDRLRDFKQKVSSRTLKLDGTGHSRGNGNDDGKPEKKRMGKKERMRLKAAGLGVEGGEQAEEQSAVVAKGRKREREQDHIQEEGAPAGDDGDGPSKKRRRRHKKGGKGEHAIEAT